MSGKVYGGGMYSKNVLVKQAATGIIAELEAKRDLANFIYTLEGSDKAERILAGGCRKCFQIGLHITGCENISKIPGNFGYLGNEPSIPASEAI